MTTLVPRLGTNLGTACLLVLVVSTVSRASPIRLISRNRLFDLVIDHRYLHYDSSLSVCFLARNVISVHSQDAMLLSSS